MNFLQKSGIGLVKLYKKFSPLHKSKCKFSPTCSSYAIEAIEKFGFFKGMILSTRRILRCNHFSKGGYDPVPINFVGDFRWLL